MSEPEFSLLDLFREEVRGQTATLSTGLVALESDPTNPQRIEPLMRAAHSIKGAARIVGLDDAVDLAHVLEDALVAAQHGRLRLTAQDIDLLLEGSDLLAKLGEGDEATLKAWGNSHRSRLDALIPALTLLARGENAPVRVDPPNTQTASTPVRVGEPVRPAEPVVFPELPEHPLPSTEEPLYDLFREELRQQLLEWRSALAEPKRQTERLQQAARAIKGAARLVGLDAVVELVGLFELACPEIPAADLPITVQAVAELLAELVHQPSGWGKEWAQHHTGELARLRTELSSAPVPTELVVSRPAAPPVVTQLPAAPVPAPVQVAAVAATVVLNAVSTSEPAVEPTEAEAVVRVTARSLNRLMSLAGESLVQARWLQPFATALLKLKKQQDHLANLVDGLAEAVGQPSRKDQVIQLLEELRKQTAVCRQILGERTGEFEEHAAAADDLNSRLYREVILSRMRPFSDGAQGLPRLVRDMARRLGRQVRLDIVGQNTEVDRDVLERLEAPLMHLVRNAIDHGIEPPEVRRAAGKPEQGTIRLEVRHRAGMLALTVSDDGAGIDLQRLRRKIVDRGLSTAELVATMNETELLEFLFLPGFTTTQTVTEYSGRGVGLDVVQDTVRKIGGSVRVSSQLGQGTCFDMQLPVTLSVLRAVLVTIAGESYAFPHNRIDRLIRVHRQDVHSLEHRQFVNVDGQNVGLVLAAQLFDLPGLPLADDELNIVLLSDQTGQYGLIVEAFRGEQDLVVRPLDPRLGKVPNVSAAAILDDGSPVLIADVEDLIRSMDQFIQSGSLRRAERSVDVRKKNKRILVVDDSITVREVERQLLRQHGYSVDVAVDGMDGWNQARAGNYHLIITDVDMPRMNGLEFIKAIREHETLQDVPVIIISYKDRPEDRLRGLEAGANAYLTKSSFHDDTFIQAVIDLIGEA